jgi:hypothetical protein
VEAEEKQVDPFAIYSACGAVFPDGDGDNYLSLCLKFKMDHQTQVRAIFEQAPNPCFSVIDAIGGGLNWPNLRALLHVESTRDILLALLVPSENQQARLKESEAWVTESKELLDESIGLSLKTRGKTWTSIADEVWRYILFSEFVFDLPGVMPDCLQDVPCAKDAARPLIYDICEQLRSDNRTQTTYIQRAETVERELDLINGCSQVKDLGTRDTFPFEERTFLRNSMEALIKNDTDTIRNVLSCHSQSVWTGKGESQVQWDLLQAALALIESCQDNERFLAEKARSMDVLIDFYIDHFRKVDQRQREFEQSLSDYAWQDANGIMVPIQEQVRKHYGKLVEKVQSLFIKHFLNHGWPLADRLANSDIFDKLVAPKLKQSGNKVAYFMVDALRYELGVELAKQLAEEGKVDLKPALVQLPSITPVGMASLLPGASKGLCLVKNEKGLIPYIDNVAVGNVIQRMDLIKKLYGHRFQEGRLEEFVRNRFKVGGDVELLVLRSAEIDSHFENNPDTAPTEIIDALKRIRVAIRKLKDLGFKQVIIVSDHGFVMNTHAGAGDCCPKLQGNWINVHDRCLLGDGGNDGNHYCISAEKAGIRGDFQFIAGPLSMASYQGGLLYYHGGVSLQECIVPVICLELEQDRKPVMKQAKVLINYKNGAKRITTRLPVIEVSIESQNLFSIDSDFEILLEAYDKKGNVVGGSKPGGLVNAATGTITLRPGDKVQVTLKMDMEFEGTFKLKALDPSTMMVYSQLDLETDYTV